MVVALVVEADFDLLPTHIQHSHQLLPFVVDRDLGLWRALVAKIRPDLRSGYTLGGEARGARSDSTIASIGDRHASPRSASVAESSVGVAEVSSQAAS